MLTERCADDVQTLQRQAAFRDLRTLQHGQDCSHRPAEHPASALGGSASNIEVKPLRAQGAECLHHLQDASRQTDPPDVGNIARHPQTAHRHPACDQMRKTASECSHQAGSELRLITQGRNPKTGRPFIVISSNEYMNILRYLQI